jgi:hypothetical protein
MRRFLVGCVAALALVALLAPGCGGEGPPESSTEGEGTGASEDPGKQFEDFDPNHFDEGSVKIDNEWFPQKAGMKYIYEGERLEEGERVPHRVELIVTDLTKVIAGVRTVVSMEIDYSQGKLIEQELAFHAQDKEGNVWHLGQYRETYDEVEFVGGRIFIPGYPEGAKAGIRMHAEPRLGSPGYSQGYAPPPFQWTDRGRVYQVGQTTSVAAGSYDDVVVIEEWDAETEAGVFQLKYHARGVGIVRIGYRGDDPSQEEMDLVEVGPLSAEELAKVRATALEMEERALIYGRTSPAEQTLSAEGP